MHSTPQFWPMRVRALLTNGPTNELLEGERRLLKEPTDKEGENKEGGEMGSRYNGRWKDRWNMHERTNSRRTATDRPHEGRPIWG